MRPAPQSRPSAWCQKVVWFRNACSVTVVLEYGLEQNCEVLSDIFLNNSMSLQS